MKLFRDEKILKFDEKEVIVYEITAKELTNIVSGAYAKNEDMLQDCTSLSADELQKLSVDAFNLIYNEFLDLNKEHFSNSEDNSGETLDKKKS